jgi:hypothetical protein
MKAGAIVITGPRGAGTNLGPGEVGVAASRIGDREPDDWPGEAHLVDHARELAQTMPELKRIDFTISTEQKQASEVARQLLAELRQTGVFG